MADQNDGVKQKLSTITTSILDALLTRFPDREVVKKDVFLTNNPTIQTENGVSTDNTRTNANILANLLRDLWSMNPIEQLKGLYNDMKTSPSPKSEEVENAIEKNPKLVENQTNNQKILMLVERLLNKDQYQSKDSWERYVKGWQHQYYQKEYGKLFVPSTVGENNTLNYETIPLNPSSNMAEAVKDVALKTVPSVVSMLYKVGLKPFIVYESTTLRKLLDFIEQYNNFIEQYNKSNPSNPSDSINVNVAEMRKNIFSIVNKPTSGGKTRVNRKRKSKRHTKRRKTRRSSKR